MIKEYKTIREIASPLMIVEHVEGVTYDELGEIELPNGDVRRCKVLEVEGDRAVVQLFESAQGINLAESKVRLRTCWAASSTAWASPSTAAPPSWPTPTWTSTACP